MAYKKNFEVDQWNSVESNPRCPSTRYDESSGSLFIYSASLVAALFRDDRLWNKRPVDPPFDRVQPRDADAARRFYEFTLLWPAFSDGSYHGQIRSALVEGLAGAVTSRTRQLLVREVESLLDAGIGQPIDWVVEVALPYSNYVLSIVLGVDVEEAGRLAKLGTLALEAIGSSPTDGWRLRSAFYAAEELQHWLGGVIAAPTSRLLATLAHTYRDLEFGPAVATAMLAQVVTGSIDPLAAALCVLAEHVGLDDLERLTISVLREEVFRLATPFRYAARHARCPLEIAGRPVDTGDRVVLHLATANMDPLTVPDPTEMRERRGFPHLAFGLGAHYCLGAGVARAAIDAVLSTMKARAIAFHPDSIQRGSGESVVRYTALTGVLC